MIAGADLAFDMVLGFEERRHYRWAMVTGVLVYALDALIFICAGECGLRIYNYPVYQWRACLSG